MAARVRLIADVVAAAFRASPTERGEHAGRAEIAGDVVVHDQVGGQRGVPLPSDMVKPLTVSASMSKPPRTHHGPSQL